MTFKVYINFACYGKQDVAEQVRNCLVSNYKGEFKKSPLHYLSLTPHDNGFISECVFLIEQEDLEVMYTNCIEMCTYKKQDEHPNLINNSIYVNTANTDGEIYNLDEENFRKYLYYTNVLQNILIRNSSVENYKNKVDLERLEVLFKSQQMQHTLQ